MKHLTKETYLRKLSPGIETMSSITRVLFQETIRNADIALYLKFGSLLEIPHLVLWLSPLFIEYR